MKRFNFLSMVIGVILLVTAASCTTLREADDDYYYERTSSAPARIYVDDPYMGTVMMERDPYTGRYYPVTPYGYGNGYPRTNAYRYYRQNNRYYRNNQGYPVYQTPPRTNTRPAPQPPTESQIREREQKRNEARKKVLGG